MPYLVPHLKGHPQNHSYSSQCLTWLLVVHAASLTTHWKHLTSGLSPVLRWTNLAGCLGQTGHSSNPYVPVPPEIHYIEIDPENEVYLDTWKDYQADTHGYSFIVRGLACALKHLQSQNPVGRLQKWRYRVMYDGRVGVAGNLEVSLI